MNLAKTEFVECYRILGKTEFGKNRIRQILAEMELDDLIAGYRKCCIPCTLMPGIRIQVS